MRVSGAIVSTSQKKGKQLFKTFSPFDEKTSDYPLKENRYGPAKVTPAYGSKPAQVTPGWMYLGKKRSTPRLLRKLAVAAPLTRLWLLALAQPLLLLT